jgi:hypothetical protein
LLELLIWHPTKSIRDLGEWEVLVTQALGELGSIEEGLRVARAGATTEACQDAIRVSHPRAQHAKLDAYLRRYLFQGVGLLGGWRNCSSLRPALLWTLWGGFWTHVGIIHMTGYMSIALPSPIVGRFTSDYPDEET